MNRNSMPACSENGVGFTKRCMCAYSQPDAHAIIAAITKAIMRERRRVHAHRLGHHHAALQRADGAALARVEQVQRGEDGGHQEEPDQVEDLATRLQRHAEDLDRRDPGEAGVAAERLGRAEQEVEADAPGDRAERQVVARQLQRQRPERGGDRERDQQAGDQREPRRRAQPGDRCRQCVRGQHGGRVGAEADERGLSERRQPADAGQQHEPERDERVQPDVVRAA